MRSDLLDYLIGTVRPNGLLSLRTNFSLAQLWAFAEGEGIGGLATYISELTHAIAPVPPLLNIRRELHLVYRADCRYSPAVQAAARWLRAIFNPVRYPCFADKFIFPNEFPVWPKKTDGALTLFQHVFEQRRSWKAG